MSVGFKSSIIFDEVSGTSVDIWAACIWRVSGTKAIRHNNPNVRTATPQDMQIHEERAMIAAATVGATSSAESEAQAPKRNAFALLCVRKNLRKNS